MNENAFDEQGREWFIPPCAKELRVASDADRVSRNPDFRTRTDKDFQLISYGQGPDGDMIVTCIGDREACEGGQVIVDRHDILFDKMPITTAALRGICAARKMYHSPRPGFLTTHDVIED